MAFVTDLALFFSNVYAKMASERALLGLPALVPNSLPNFQIGGEFGPEAQIAPRVVIVPTGVESYDFSQQMPFNQSGTDISRVSRKSVYRRWLTFDAQLWGEPDQTARDVSDPTNPIAPGVPNPTYAFNSTIELEREFIVAIVSLIGSAGQAWAPISATWPPANVANNRYGRLLVLSFKIAPPVTQTPYVILPYSQVPGDGGVVRQITPEISVDGGCSYQPACSFTIPP
jgi:hypothetical protein